MRRWFTGLLGAVGMAAVLLAAHGGSHGGQVLHISSVGPRVELATLIESADAAALVVPTGATRAHWNSADGEPWSNDAGVQAWIYWDVEMKVMATLFGSLPATVEIRGVGGTVGDTTMLVDEQPEWLPDATYLVILRERDTPLANGSERAWTEAVFGQSTFALRKGQWVNALTGLSVSLAEVKR